MTASKPYSNGQVGYLEMWDVMKVVGFRRECDRFRHKYVLQRDNCLCMSREVQSSVQCPVHHCGKQLDTSRTDDGTTTKSIQLRKPEPVVAVTA